MRKLLWIIPTIFILTLVCIITFIPSRLAISKIVILNSNQKSVYRCLNDPQILKTMAEQSKSDISSDSTFVRFNEVAFQFKEQMSDFIAVPIAYKDLHLNSHLTIIKKGIDSSAVGWRTEIMTSKNPFKRIQQYYMGKKIKNAMSEILESLKVFVSKEKNIYGLDIFNSNIIDTFLITAKAKTTSYPTKEEYYILIKKLESYISEQGAVAANYPMLNITVLDSNSFEAMAAIPVNKELPDKNNIIFKKMVAGKVIVSEVRGGRNNIEEGFTQLANYASDYQLSLPALYYQSLVTNRMTEVDSSKWITKLYFPVR